MALLTPKQIVPGSGIAVAWVNFDGTGVVAITDDFNVSSITDNTTGDYTINFTSALNNADYAVVASGYHSPTWGGNYIMSAIGKPLLAGVTKSTTAFRVGYNDSGSTMRDFDTLMVAFFST